MTAPYQLLGTQTSYYTAKVRAYMHYKAIPHVELNASAEVYRDVIIPRTGIGMVPVLITPDDMVVQDTTIIIDLLESRFQDPAVHPSTPRQKLAALLLELFGDEWLIMTAIHYRWTKPENTEFATRQFGEQLLPDAPAEEQYAAGVAKARIYSGWVHLLGSDEVTGPAIEEAYMELLAALNTHFERYEFLFGSRPSIADFSIFGAFFALLYRDPFSGRLMDSCAPNVVGWIHRLLNPEPNAGSFLAGDEVPKSLDPVFRAILRDHLPVLIDTMPKLAAWAKDNPYQCFPRTIGRHDFVLRGRKGTRCVYPYPQWMLQRALDHYDSISAVQKPAVDAWILEQGGREFMNIEIPQPVALFSNRLVPAAAKYKRFLAEQEIKYPAVSR